MIYGGYGLVISDSDIIDELVNNINEKHPDIRPVTKWELDDFMNAQYVPIDCDANVFPSGKMDGFANKILNSCLIIWGSNDIDMTRVSYANKDKLIEEIKENLSDYLIPDTVNSLDYDDYCGLILYNSL